MAGLAWCSDANIATSTDNAEPAAGVRRRYRAGLSWFSIFQKVPSTLPDCCGECAEIWKISE
jgi:hypothetical protein